MTGNTLGWVIVAFVLYLLMMIAIGAFYAKGNNNSEDYFLGGRKLHGHDYENILPVMKRLYTEHRFCLPALLLHFLLLLQKLNLLHYPHPDIYLLCQPVQLQPARYSYKHLCIP